MIRISIFCAALFSILSAFALPKNDPVPGGLAVIPIAISSETEIKATFNDKPVITVPYQNKWLALVPIPLTQQPGPAKIKVISADDMGMLSFKINDKEYPLSKIHIPDQSKVTPSKALAKKIVQQAELMQKIMQTYNSDENVHYDFVAPVQGKISSPFGQKRILNNVKQTRHLGLDIAAKTGTPIHAAANGKVLAAENFILTGNTVFIDHGQGLITVYCHLSKVDVHAGDIVKQNQIIGNVGTTGRSTAAHLHWGVSVAGTKVNPLLFVKNS